MYAKKVHKFATKFAPQQNSVNQYFEILINILQIVQGVFFHWYSPEKLKYGKPRLGESTLT